MFSHITLGTNDMRRAQAFYAAVMPVVGLQPAKSTEAFFAYGPGGDGLPWIVVNRPFDGLPATWGNGFHIAFRVADRASVDRFHAAALSAGGRDEGAPGLRPDYGPDYYGAYVRDPDGAKLQAVTYERSLREGPQAGLISHVTSGTNDLARAAAFYEAVLAPLGLARIREEESAGIDAAFGAPGANIPLFYAHVPFDGRPATWGNGAHTAFLAPDRAAVDAFHAAALAQDGTDEGAPGLRPQYHASYYAAYARDPDGNKLQAVCHNG